MTVKSMFLSIERTLNGIGSPHLPQNKTSDALSTRDKFSRTAGRGTRLNVSELPNTAGPAGKHESSHKNDRAGRVPQGGVHVNKAARRRSLFSIVELSYSAFAPCSEQLNMRGKEHLPSAPQDFSYWFCSSSTDIRKDSRNRF